MEIEWALVVFTALTGCGGWMALFIAVDVLAGKSKQSNLVACVVDILFLGIGGVSSVFHLQHPDRILNALSQPTSGIFVEAVLVGLCALAVFVLLIMLVKNAGAQAQKVVSVIAAVLGLLLAFMAGHSYMMEAIPAWNTYLLPIGYLLTAAPSGAAAYLAVLAFKGEENDVLAFNGKLLLGAGLVAIVGAAAFGVSTLQGGLVLTLWIVAALVGGCIGGVCGYAVMKKPSNAKTLAVVALVCGLAGAVLYRVVMWLSGVAATNFFGNL